ncbi:hypothetical protein [Streptomyces yunnanensis]|uniref:hypothetical protein n=1 Tax=Streptomyces yunnanensis TaxID=156453 RepID=UPI00142E32DD|nr:hypothetical protein [Streptomyces yunnanensis]
MGEDEDEREEGGPCVAVFEGVEEADVERGAGSVGSHQFQSGKQALRAGGIDGAVEGADVFGRAVQVLIAGSLTGVSARTGACRISWSMATTGWRRLPRESLCGWATWLSGKGVLSSVEYGLRFRARWRRASNVTGVLMWT